MNQAEALRKIQGLGVPSLETRDVSALLGVTPANASVVLGRLAARGFVRHLARGRWAVGAVTNSDDLPEQLTSPSPAYLSLQSALFRRGLIEQIPEVVYAVTLGRARRIRTGTVTISLHKMPPELFGGFTVEANGSKVATAEKALFDLAYLSPTRIRLFAATPEIEIPRSFRWSEVHRWTNRIAGRNRRTFVERRLATLRNPPSSSNGTITAGSSP
jgi:predicted transcriptional regulator of viral defense system